MFVYIDEIESFKCACLFLSQMKRLLFMWRCKLPFDMVKYKERKMVGYWYILMKMKTNEDNHLNIKYHKLVVDVSLTGTS